MSYLSTKYLDGLIAENDAMWVIDYGLKSALSAVKTSAKSSGSTLGATLPVSECFAHMSLRTVLLNRWARLSPNIFLDNNIMLCIIGITF